MWRGGCGLDIVARLGNDGERGLLRVAVGLLGLHDVGSLAQLCLPHTVTDVLSLKEDVGLVVDRHEDIAEVVAHVTLLDVDHLGLCGIVIGGDIQLQLTLIAVLLGLNLVLAEVQVLVVNRRLAHRDTVDVNLRLGNL